MQNANLCAQNNVLDEIRSVAKDWITEIDLFALNSVENGVGGPFGAAIYLYDALAKTREMVGTIMGNAVLSTGCGSAHAEDRALNSSHIEILKDRLSRLRDQQDHPQDHLYVVMVSSAESCPACHSKEQIVARDLIADKLLAEGHFVVVYGATYQETADVAGFHDAPYFEDLQNNIGEGLIKLRQVGVQEIPANICEILQQGRDTCVVVQDGHILAYGFDAQTSTAPFASASYTSIQSACRTQKDRGTAQPWNLRGAVLYTTQADIGPLTYTECQWANISTIIQIKTDSKSVPTCEAAQVPNGVLFKVVGSQDYSHPKSAVYMMKLENFANLAQHGWKTRLENIGDSILYNGIDAA